MNLLMWIVLSSTHVLSVVSNAVEKVKLSSGYDMPLVGLATDLVSGKQAEEVVILALKKGYRHIDTCISNYNEKKVGKALKKWFEKGGKREDLFITSKLPYITGDVNKFLLKSLKNMGLRYVDMYLLDARFRFHEDFNYKGVWKEMEEQVKNGLAKSIGVSNFNKTQLETVYYNATIEPSNLQVEAHAYFPQKSLRDYCKKHNIVMTAHAPFGTSFEDETYKDPSALKNNPTVKKIANKYNRTSGQVLLRFSTQRRIVVLPGSLHPNEIEPNIHIFDFELTDEDYKKLDALDRGENGRVWDYKKLFESTVAFFEALGFGSIFDLSGFRKLKI